MFGGGSWKKGEFERRADKAVDALGDLEKKVKASWSDDQKKAYRELEAQAALDRNPRAKHQYGKAKEEVKNVDPQINLAVQRVKEADDEAYDARIDAEKTFDKAERLLSSSMAREGDQKAIDSWDLPEKAIRKAEALARRK